MQAAGLRTLKTTSRTLMNTDITNDSATPYSYPLLVKSLLHAPRATAADRAA